MSEDRIGRLLDTLSEELATAGAYSSLGKCTVYELVEVKRVLKERIGPLIRAGQAMHDSLEMQVELGDDTLLNWENTLAALEGKMILTKEQIESLASDVNFAVAKTVDIAGKKHITVGDLYETLLKTLATLESRE